MHLSRAGEKGDRSFISSKLISEDAVGMCVKVSGLEGLQVDQFLGDGVSLDEEEFAEICKVMEDDQPLNWGILFIYESFDVSKVDVVQLDCA